MTNDFTAGDFNKLGKVYRRNENATKDAGGQIDPVATDATRLVCDRHFNIVPRNSREFVLGDQIRGEVTHQLATTYDKASKGFKSTWQFVYQGRTFNFAGPGINWKEKNRWLVFPATEVPTV